MTQFSVYQNPGRNADVPFFVQVQSGRLGRSPGRVVIPLHRCGLLAPGDHPLTPHLIVQGQAVYANPLNLATIPVVTLKQALELLQERDQDRIIRAIDEMISRA